MTTFSPPMLTQEEQEQLNQTVEMFEVIVQANPHDTQSLEILKDAYSRLGKKSEFLKVCKRMAQTFVELGQFSTAILEYEQLLREDPDDPEIIASMGDCEERMHRSYTAPTPVVPETSESTGTLTGGGIMATSATRHGSQRMPASGLGGRIDGGLGLGQGPDANEVLAKFLIQHRLAPEEIVNHSLEHIQKINASLRPSSMGASLIQELIDRGQELDPILCGILDRTKFSYIPLEYYDVDRHVVKMLPEDLTLSRLILPFDVVSRTVMIAIANPFDAAAKDAAQSRLDYNVQWHIASPTAIMHALSQVYRGVHATHAAPAPVSAPPPPPEPAEAPIFGEIPTPLPIPELKVSNSSAPLSSPEFGGEAPLPDTTDFRIKK